MSHLEQSPITPPDMTGIKPGSPEEKQIHQQYVEARNVAVTAEHDGIVAKLGALANPAGVISPDVERAVRRGQDVSL